jgi:hypothetical protein
MQTVTRSALSRFGGYPSALDERIAHALDVDPACCPAAETEDCC